MIVYRPTRKRLPKSRTSRTTSFTVGGAEGYMTSGAHDDGELGEVFLKLGKQGSTLAGVMDAFSIAVSIGLQYGVPLETYVSKFTNLSFEPNGLTDDADVRMAKSIMDYIFRRLALDYLDLRGPPGPRHLLRRGAPALPRDRLLRARRPRSATPPRSSATSAPRVEPSVEPSSRPSDAVEAERVETKDTHGTEQREVPAHAAQEAHTSAELLEKITGTAVDSPLCMTCGTKMRPAGSCYVCEGCGSTSGCS